MILRDFALYLAMILATFLMLALVFTFFELLTDIVRNKVPLITVAEYLWNLSPSMIYLMAPMAVMLAVLITFGLMEKSSELTAMKATGFSVYRATLPVIVLSAFFAAGLFVFDQVYIPHTNREQEILRNEIKGKPAQTYLQADRKWIFGQNNEIYYYRVFDPDTETLRRDLHFRIRSQKIPANPPYLRRACALGARPAQSGSSSRAGSGPCSGSSIQDYRTFDVATFNELHEDPGYFKKEVRQSSEMDYDELAATTSMTCSKAASTPFA